MYSYLTDRKHSFKIKNSFSNFIDLLICTLKGSVLGPFLLTIYICDLFFFVEEETVSTYADDTTLYSSGDNIATVLENIENIEL